MGKSAENCCFAMGRAPSAQVNGNGQRREHQCYKNACSEPSNEAKGKLPPLAIAPLISAVCPCIQGLDTDTIFLIYTKRHNAATTCTSGGKRVTESMAAVCTWRWGDCSGGHGEGGGGCRCRAWGALRCGSLLQRTLHYSRCTCDSSIHYKSCRCQRVNMPA
jgi:hypothetical protein